MGYSAFLERMGEVNDLLNAESILNWDARTMMPPRGGDTRAKQLATLTVVARDHLVADETRRLLEQAEAETANLARLSVIGRASILSVAIVGGLIWGGLRLLKA